MNGFTGQPCTRFGDRVLDQGSTHQSLYVFGIILDGYFYGAVLLNDNRILRRSDKIVAEIVSCGRDKTVSSITTSIFTVGLKRDQREA